MRYEIEGRSEAGRGVYLRSHRCYLLYSSTCDIQILWQRQDPLSWHAELGPNRKGRNRECKENKEVEKDIEASSRRKKRKKI